MRTGQVGSVRELAGPRVQARVCLGATVREGYAIITVETASEEVLAALDALKAAVKRDAYRYVTDVLEGTPAFKEEKR